jgi:hypothetical protein
MRYGNILNGGSEVLNGHVDDFMSSVDKDSEKLTGEWCPYVISAKPTLL